MAKKKIKREDSNKKKEESLLALSLRIITGIYLVMVLGALPFYAPDAYYSIGDYKWELWIWTTAVYIAVMSIICAGLLIKYLKNKDNKFDIKEWAKKNLNTTDWFVIAYLLVCVISSVFSPYKEQILLGTEGWNMGLLSQLGFIFAYFYISRTWKYSNSFMRWMVVCSSVVFLYGTVMRFGVDPIGFYNGLTDTDKFFYISTLGQTSWYSSFLVLLVPIAIMIYHNANILSVRVFGIVAVVIGYMSMVTQNSDSAYLALVAYMLVYFYIAFESYDDMMRFLEVVMMNLLSFRFIGVLQDIKGEQATQLDSLSMTMSHTNLTIVLFAVVLVIYIVLYCLNKKGKTPDVTRVAFLRIAAPVLTGIAIIAAIVYISLNTAGKLPEGLLSDNNYLVFNEFWGNSRGINWSSALYTFVHEDLFKKIIGTGPDTFGASVYEFYGQQIHDYYYNLSGMEYVLYCAHNEWLNVLITGGILGLISYLGMYIVAFIRCMKNGKKCPELYGIALAIAAYVAHNAFCYQQVICTSVIIVFLGIAEATIRNGYVQWDELNRNNQVKRYTLSEIIKGLMGN